MRACKEIAKSKIKNLSQFRTEIKILQNLDHPNIIKLFEFFEDEDCIYLIMEVCSGGELFDRIIEQDYLTEVGAAQAFK